MAGDWIKAEHTLPDKPEVVAMAARLNIDQDAVVGKLIRLWIWADQQIAIGNESETEMKRNCNALTVTHSFIDRVTYCTGFASALVEVGWLVFGDDGRASFVNIERHNGTTAKQRASTYRRVQSSRAKKRKCNGSVTVGALSSSLPETETETEILNTHTPAAEEVGRVPLAESFSAYDAGVVCVEIDGELVAYDQNSLAWEAEFVRQWNSTNGTVKHSSSELSIPHRNLLRARLSDPNWRWKLALSLFPLWSETGWIPGLMWFLKDGSVQGILEGQYHRKPQTKGKRNDRQVSNPGQVYNEAVGQPAPPPGRRW